MAIFAISDVIISITLLINAFALMSTKLIGGDTTKRRNTISISSSGKTSSNNNNDIKTNNNSSSSNISSSDSSGSLSSSGGDLLQTSDSSNSSSNSSSSSMSNVGEEIDGEQGISEKERLMDDVESAKSSASLEDFNISNSNGNSDSQVYSLSSRLKGLAQLIRSLSATIVVWNIIFFILMFFVFPE
jgi:hypothetical protein